MAEADDNDSVILRQDSLVDVPAGGEVGKEVGHGSRRAPGSAAGEALLRPGGGVLWRCFDYDAVGSR